MTRHLKEYYYDNDAGNPVYVQLYDDEVEYMKKKESVHNLRETD